MKKRRNSRENEKRNEKLCVIMNERQKKNKSTLSLSLFHTHTQKNANHILKWPNLKETKLCERFIKKK